MTKIQVVALVALVGFAGLAADCGGGGGNKDDDLRIYLGPDGKMYKWEKDVTAAICKLEEHTSGIPDEEKYCPPGNPTGTPPPSYPPAK